MPLPEVIEIMPMDKVVHGEITVPGSKSITNRALVLAALGEGETVLQGALWSEDTQTMVECLQDLGFMVNVAHDPAEPCNRTITVYGKGGVVPAGGTEQQPLELFVANAGTAARFLTAFVCLGKGVYRLHGISRMHERPQGELLKALRELGYRVESENKNDKLPVRIWGGGGGQRSCTVSIEESSQFASALLLCARVGGWQVRIEGEGDEAPYVAMTERLIETFACGKNTFQVEPDASSGSYFWGAGWISAVLSGNENGSGMAGFDKLPLVVRNWPDTGWQIDAEFPHFIPLPDSISREGQLGDSIMTAIVLAADWEAAQHVIESNGQRRFAGRDCTIFSDLGRLRVQECERVAALRTELTKCGAKVVEKGDTLTVFPSKLHGAEIETYNDHRMAMCFAILGLKVSGIKIKNPACVKKTFPNFFQKLATQPPHGIGVRIIDATTREPLTGENLFAD
jgi:3-phosphoshikimate 1-carboxyvinyltransferase